jgi:hypothetical protein
MIVEEDHAEKGGRGTPRSQVQSAILGAPSDSPSMRARSRPSSSIQ